MFMSSERTKGVSSTSPYLLEKRPVWFPASRSRLPQPTTGDNYRRLSTVTAARELPQLLPMSGHGLLQVTVAPGSKGTSWIGRDDSRSIIGEPPPPWKLREGWPAVVEYQANYLAGITWRRPMWQTGSACFLMGLFVLYGSGNTCRCFSSYVNS